MKKEEIVHHANEDVLGGLKAAIDRGEDLKDAMMSFYNAGYNKTEIETAARQFLREKSEAEELESHEKTKEPKEKQEFKRPEDRQKVKKGKYRPGADKEKSEKPSPRGGATFGTGKKEEKRTTKKISSYGKSPKRKRQVMTIILIIVLVVLLGVLATVILFKDNLITFFNNLFG